MRAVVFSDSHGDSASINMLLSLHRNADMFIYLGDGEEDLFMPQNLNIIGTKPLIAVKGNNDFGSSLPAETTCFLSGKKYTPCTVIQRALNILPICFKKSLWKTM